MLLLIQIMVRNNETTERVATSWKGPTLLEEVVSIPLEFQSRKIVRKNPLTLITPHPI
jgi:hypothetical protein